MILERSRHLTFCMFFLSSLLIPISARAEISIKEAVIKDCAVAQKLLPQITPAERAELTGYLALLIKQPSPEVALPNPAGLLIHPASSTIAIGDVSGGELASVLDVPKEAETKRCALRLLTQIGAESFQVIHDLVALPTEQEFSRMEAMLAEALYESVLSISAQTKRARPDLASQTGLTELLARVNQRSLPYAKGVFMELDPLANVFLLAEFIKAFEHGKNSERFQALADILRELSMQGSLEMVDSAPFAATLIEILKTDQGKFGGAVDRILADIDGMNEGLDAQLLAVANEAEPALRTRIILILAKRGPDRSETFKYLIKALDDQSREVEFAAVWALGLSLQRKEQAKRTLLGHLKRMANYPSDVKSLALHLSAFSVFKLELSAKDVGFIPYLVEALQLPLTAADLNQQMMRSWGITLAGLIAAPEYGLTSIGQKAIDAMLTAKRKGAAIDFAALARIIGRVRPISATSLRAVITGLSSQFPAERELAGQVLLSAGKVAAQELRSAVNSNKDETTGLSLVMSSAQLLAVLDPTDRSAISKLERGLGNKDCRQRTEIIALLTKVMVSHKDLYKNELLPCLSGQVELGVKLKALSVGAKLGFDLALMIGIVSEALAAEDIEIQQSAVEIVSSLAAESSKELVPALLKVYKQLEPDHEGAFLTLLEIMRRDPAAVDGRGVFVNTIRDGRITAAKPALLRAPPGFVVDVARVVLAKAQTEQKIQMLRVLALRGSSVDMALPLLETLLDDVDDELRYAVAVSILKIAPSSPLALRALRPILISRFPHRLLREQLPVELLPNLQTVLQSAGSETERHNAIRLAKALRS